MHVETEYEKRFAWIPRTTESGETIWWDEYYIKETRADDAGCIITMRHFYSPEEVVLIKLKQDSGS